MAEKNSKDHDLLIRLETKLDQAVSDIKDLKANTVGRIEMLEETKCNATEFKDLSARVVTLEKWQNYVIGLSVTAAAVATFLAVKLFEHLTQVPK
jgi:hypothetical protein